MASGFTFLHEVISADKAPLVNCGIVAAIVGAMAYVGKRSLAAAEDSAIPDDKISCRSVFETLTSLILKLGDIAMGKDNRRYLPFILTLFLYLFALNLFGLVPGFILSTDQYQINIGIALATFAMYNLWGIKEVGIKGYLAHLWGPVFVLGFMLFPIELISHGIRPLTLSLRIFGNMTGDHNLLSAMNQLTAGPFTFWMALPFYFLGTLVCFVQALVFTLLMMVYIRLAVSH